MSETPFRRRFWLRWLAAVSLAAGCLPLIGMAVPALDDLRGFMYAWIPLGFVWLYFVLPFLIASRLRKRSDSNGSVKQETL
jgi:hypothetical protein